MCCDLGLFLCPSSERPLIALRARPIVDSLRYLPRLWSGSDPADSLDPPLLLTPHPIQQELPLGQLKLYAESHSFTLASWLLPRSVHHLNEASRVLLLTLRHQSQRNSAKPRAMPQPQTLPCPPTSLTRAQSLLAVHSTDCGVSALRSSLLASDRPSSGSCPALPSQLIPLPPSSLDSAVPQKTQPPVPVLIFYFSPEYLSPPNTSYLFHSFCLSRVPLSPKGSLQEPALSPLRPGQCLAHKSCVILDVRAYEVSEWS